MPDKLTDAEVKKALAQCENQTYCSDCPYYTKIGCKKHLYQDALDLINRQEVRIHQQEKIIIEIQNANLIDFKATIENYKAEIERLEKVYDLSNRACQELRKRIEAIKAEALKEAASKFAGHSDYHGDAILCTLYCMAEGKEVGNAKPLDTNKIKAEAYKEAFEKANEIITEIYNKHIFGSNDLESDEKDAIINFSDDVTYRLDNLLNELVGGSDGEND